MHYVDGTEKTATLDVAAKCLAYLHRATRSRDRDGEKGAVRIGWEVSLPADVMRHLSLQ